MLLRETNIYKLFCLPSKKGSTLKGKTLLPFGANSFLLEQITFQKGLAVRESETESQKMHLPLYKWRKIYHP